MEQHFTITRYKLVFIVSIMEAGSSGRAAVRNQKEDVRYAAHVECAAPGCGAHWAFIWRVALSNLMEELAGGGTACAKQGTDKRHNAVLTFS